MTEETCPACQVGRLKATTATYVEVYQGTLIQAPNTAAWRCDTCGQVYFDEAAIQRLNALIGTGGLPPNRPAPSAWESSVTNDGPSPLTRPRSG
jgi:YgiT-type zinc finger domain-containing protein